MVTWSFRDLTLSTDVANSSHKTHKTLYVLSLSIYQIQCWWVTLRPNNMWNCDLVSCQKVITLCRDTSYELSYIVSRGITWCFTWYHVMCHVVSRDVSRGLPEFWLLVLGKIHHRLVVWFSSRVSTATNTTNPYLDSYYVSIKSIQ